jgi:hypothetical protein
MPCGAKAAPGGSVQAAEPQASGAPGTLTGSRVMVPLAVSYSASEPLSEPSISPIWLISNVCPSGSSSMSSGYWKPHTATSGSALAQPVSSSERSDSQAHSSAATNAMSRRRISVSLPRERGAMVVCGEHASQRAARRGAWAI